MNPLVFFTEAAEEPAREEIGMVEAFFNDPAGEAAVAIFIVGLLQFLLDQAKAIRDHTFSLVGIGDWLARTFVGRIAPIWLLLFVGWAAQGVELIGTTLMVSAIAWSGIYVAETIKKILNDWMPSFANGSKAEPPKPPEPPPPVVG